jgi:bifunctional UDP-N-acetylglucosamine pyrophosphorylase/glucosamine-1-phosphate N-acetyltransferase
VVLAAGQGKRMHSALPKVMHPISGRPLLAHVLATARRLEAARIVVVVGHGAGMVRGAFPDSAILWAEQREQLGTGHAVQQALPLLPASGIALVLYGDVPLISSETLADLLSVAGDDALALLTQEMEEPAGYGRIVRDRQGCVTGIVEERDATPAERAIRETNTGILAAPVARLAQWLARLDNRNSQGEYYLTDIIAMAVADGVEIVTRAPRLGHECQGVNSKADLAALERRHQMKQARELLEAGVTLADPARIDIRGELACGREVAIDVNCIFEGAVSLGDGVTVGANCIVRDATIGANTAILPFTFIDGATVGANARIGPYARLRPETTLADGVHIGNFVEVKASRLGQGSKANHLAYVGDASVGRDVNIGAGTITCNYDGAAKHRTVIEDDVHIGSDVQLVAPVTVGKGATIGAGATITKDVPPGGLALTEKKQVYRSDWARPRKK